MRVRPVSSADSAAWAAMRACLWPDADPGELAAEVTAFLAGASLPVPIAAFVATASTPIGFLELGLRPYANGCTSMPVPFVEGWYVEPEARGRGVGRLLLGGAEAWCRDHGYFELGSDTQLWNEASLQAHGACGFSETERVVYLRKDLSTR
ncbi:MAG TPA: GNAT family N-acetyltransferase [Candidatus Cybelea sp.]|nr:GNAT family N-acetyltransferase [Candidatus Cybelea sp.]